MNPNHAQTNKIIKISVAFVLLIGIVSIGVFASRIENENFQKGSEVGNESMRNTENMPNEKTPDISSDEKVSVGSYEAYSPAKVSVAQGKNIVLFFHASWCPTCRALNADIENHLATIPSDTVLLKVDYDSEVELRKKYGVTYQHTLVQVDSDAQLIHKWSGSPTLVTLLSQIK